MAIVTRSNLADLQKLEKGKQMIEQHRVCEVSYTYSQGEGGKILPARGLLLQVGTGDVKQRQAQPEFGVPVHSRGEMTLTRAETGPRTPCGPRSRRRPTRDKR